MGNRGVIKAGDVQRMFAETDLTHSEHNLRPLQNAPFCPISVTCSNFNPQKTQCIRACPVGPEDRTGWLIRQSSVADSPSLNLNIIEHFSKVSLSDKPLHFYQIWIYPDQRGLEPSYDQMNCHLTDHPAFLHNRKA